MPKTKLQEAITAIIVFKQLVYYYMRDRKEWEQMVLRENTYLGLNGK